MSDAVLPADTRPAVNRLHAAGLIALFMAISAGALSYAKWLPYSHKLEGVIAHGVYPGKAIVSIAKPAPVTWSGAWHFTVTYGKAVWVALAAALLIGASLEAFLPRSLLHHSLGRRGFRSSLLAGATSMPCMMCTCCSAPVVRSMRRSGASKEAALSFWLGNPLLNPVVIAFLALLLPWQFAAVRVVVGAALVFLAAPLIARFVPADTTAQSQIEVEQPRPRHFFTALGRLGLFLVPEYFMVVLLVGAFRGVLFPVGHSAAGLGLLAAVAVATLGTLLVVPTAGEVPIVVGLIAAGFSPLAAGAAMIALPALSLPSMVMVGRSLTWRVVASAAGVVAMAALAAGAVVVALGA